MLLICGVLLMVTGLAEALYTIDQDCRYNPSCVLYGALGRPLYLQLPDEYDVKLAKDISETSSKIMFRFRNHTIRRKDPDPRWQFVPENRSMVITRAEKNDSGRYRLDDYDSEGRGRQFIFHLRIEAVVSSVEVMSSCFSIKKRRVFCLSDGDQTQFTWTLSGTTVGPRLTDGNQTLLLDEDYTGNVTCHVKNPVSSGNRTIELQQCPGIPVFVLVWVLEIIILLALLLGFHIYGRILRKRSIK